MRYHPNPGPGVAQTPHFGVEGSGLKIFLGTIAARDPGRVVRHLGGAGRAALFAERTSPCLRAQSSSIREPVHLF